MSFVYPRLITVTRHTPQNGVGAIGYSGLLKTTETTILSNVRASIQHKKEGRTPSTNLPSDGRLTLWRILFNAPMGTVNDRDVITDDLGIRYQVQAAYWNSLGYNCLCERLEA